MPLAPRAIKTAKWWSSMQLPAMQTIDALLLSFFIIRWWWTADTIKGIGINVCPSSSAISPVVLVRISEDFTIRCPPIGLVKLFSVLFSNGIWPSFDILNVVSNAIGETISSKVWSSIASPASVEIHGIPRAIDSAKTFGNPSLKEDKVEINSDDTTTIVVNGTKTPNLAQEIEAKIKGYEGEACGECGNFTLVRNGTCMKCNTCGATSGCSWDKGF